MGGKNCVIVDADADLDEAVPEIVYSAFGYAGQKCSAASRVLVHEAIADALVERLAGAVAVLRVGQADDFATDVPPVIDAEARERVRRYAAAGRARGRRSPPRGASCPQRTAGSARRRSPPTCPSGSPVLREEIFGPLLAVSACADVDAACDVVDALPFALTGGLFSRSPADGRARDAAALRSATSTSTAASPARWSGASRSAATAAPAVGSKAGGPDYLLQFVEPRVVTENTMRHGMHVD